MYARQRHDLVFQKLIPVAVQEMIHFQTLEMEKEQTMAAKTYWKGEFYFCVVINGCSVMAEQGTHSEVETNHREREPTEGIRTGCLVVSYILSFLHALTTEKTFHKSLLSK